MTQKTLLYPKNTLEEVQVLIKNGTNVNERDFFRRTPLHYIENIHIVQLLIEHGADVNALDVDQCTPLFFVQNKDILQLLITQGAEVNIREIDGLTPLDCQDDIDHAKYLIDHGAINGKIQMYKYFRHLFTEEQQKAFDTFLTITSNDDDFFHVEKDTDYPINSEG